MNFSSLQENLKKGLQTVGHLSGKNINLPILNNVLIKAENGSIKIISTNLEIGITYDLRGQVQEEGLFTVDSKLISDYIGLLPNEKINILKQNDELFIKTNNYKTKIKGQSADDFPLIPKVETENIYKIKTEELKKALPQVSFAMSNSDVRLELSGVFMDFKEGELILASTDSYRLAERKIKIKKDNGDDVNIILPAKTIQEILRILGNIDEDVKEIEVKVGDNQVLFKIGPVELVSRVIEGQYPDYTQIIPKESRTKIEIDRGELIRAVKASSIFSRSEINDVNLDFPKDKNEVIVSAILSSKGENISKVEASVKGDDNGVVVNYNYLLDGLNTIKNEKVFLEVVDNNTPCILKSKEDNYFYMIMPIKQ